MMALGVCIFTSLTGMAQSPVFTWKPDPLIFYDTDNTVEISVTGLLDFWGQDTSSIIADIRIDNGTWSRLNRKWIPLYGPLVLTGMVQLENPTTSVEVRLAFSTSSTPWISKKTLILQSPNLTFIWKPSSLIFTEQANDIELEIWDLPETWLQKPLTAHMRISKGFWNPLVWNSIDEKVSLSGQIHLDNPSSLAEVYIQVNDSEYTYDLAETMIYRKPEIQLLSYETSIQKEVSFNSQTIVTKDLTLKVKALIGATEIGSHVDGDEVTSVEWMVNNSGHWNLQPLTNPGYQKQEVLIDISGGIGFGMNHIVIRAKGNEPNEYSETKSFDVFLWGIDKNSISTKLTIFDENLYKIPGQPSGGWYTGVGIAGKTPWFDPSTAGAGIHEIVYHYELEGNIFIDSVEIVVSGKARPEFEISGPFQACPQSSHKYQLISDDIEGIEWSVEGGEIVDISNESDEINVKWKSSAFWGQVPPSNRIGYVFATRDSSDEETDRKTLIVDIGDIDAPRTPTLFFGDIDHRLLICNSDSVNLYKWFKLPATTIFPDDTLNISLPDAFATSTKPYIYLPSKPEENSVFFVELANYSNCPTRGFIVNNKSSLVRIGMDPNIYQSNFNGFSIFPNPANDYCYIKLDQPARKVTAEIVNLLGEVLVHKEFVDPGENTIKLILTGLTDGLYYVRAYADGREMRPAKLIFTSL